jgi:hypothetical protein
MWLTVAHRPELYGVSSVAAFGPLPGECSGPCGGVLGAGTCRTQNACVMKVTAVFGDNPTRWESVGGGRFSACRDFAIDHGCRR